MTSFWESDTPVGGKFWESDAPIEKPENAKKPSLVNKLGRQVGLAARAGIQGGLGPFDMFAAPIRMAGNAIAPGTFTQTGGSAVADILGLPKPETDLEKAVGQASEILAGTASAAKGADLLSRGATGITKKVLSTLADNTKVQLQSATGAALGAEYARQAKLGPWGTLLATFAGGIFLPVGARVTNSLVEPVKDIAATVHASVSKNQQGWGTRRLLTDAVERGLGDSKDFVRTAAYNSKPSPIKPTMGQAVAERNMGKPNVRGGWLVRLEKDLTGAAGVEDALPSTFRQQAAAVDDAMNALERTAGPIRSEVLGGINAKTGGISARRLSQSLDDLAANPEIAGDKAMSTAIRLARGQVDGLQKNGRINAKAIYSMRKSFNKTVAKAAEVAEGTLGERDTKKMGWLTHQVQLAIDGAIEEAAGSAGMAKQWQRYLDTYSSGLRRIGEHADRVEQAAEIAKNVKPTSGAVLAPGEIPKPPTLLNRKMMAANFFLRSIASDANDPAVKELTRLLQDPAEFAKLLQRPAKDTLKQRALEAIHKGEVAIAVGYQQEQNQ